MAALWADIAAVLAVTGKTVAQDVVDRAENTVEVLTGAVATSSTTLLNRRDLYWLKQMVCYQAAWENDQPDLYTRSDVSSVQQDGAGATYKPDALVLAPMAKRCAKRLSWRGTRTLTPTGAAVRVRDLDLEAQDNAEDWRALT